MMAQHGWDTWLYHLSQWRTHPLEALNTHEGGYVLALVFSLLLPLLRRTLRSVFWEPCGKIILTNAYKKSEKPASDDTLAKWNESAWKATFYIGVVAVGIAAAWHERFVTDTKHFWLGCDRFPPCNYSIPVLMRVMYSLELGFYLQAVPYLFLWEVRRKDFWENFAHHLATIGLIVYSYEVNFMKIGTMVFLCHDINDIFMELAKLSKYARREGLANVLFASFVISWFATRMFYFPVWIIRSAWYEPIEIIADQYNINPHPHHEIFLTLLCFLFALHSYWSYLILRIVVKQVIRGELEDIREEKHAQATKLREELQEQVPRSMKKNY